MASQDFVKSGLRTVEMEALAVSQLAPFIDSNYETACKTILACEGRVVVTRTTTIGKGVCVRLKIQCSHSSDSQKMDFGEVLLHMEA